MEINPEQEKPSEGTESKLRGIKKENEMSKDNYIQRKFEINLEIEKKNDINIFPNIEQNKLNKQKLILHHHYFKDNDFIIVKKVNLNIIKEKQIKNYSIDNNINNSEEIEDNGPHKGIQTWQNNERKNFNNIINDNMSSNYSEKKEISNKKIIILLKDC